jgi:hypothetical protein
VLIFRSRRLSDNERYLPLEGVRVQNRWAGKVRRQRGFCACGITRQGLRELAALFACPNCLKPFLNSLGAGDGAEGVIS